MEGAVVAVQRLHHRQVGSDQEEQYGFTAEQAVPRPLEHALEGVDAVHEIRNLVDDDHARAVVGQDLREEPECGIPLPRGLLREQVPLRQSRSGDGVEQLRQFVLRRPTRRGEEEVRRLDAPEELLDEAGLADPPASAHQNALTGLRRPGGIMNRLKGAAEHVQLAVPPDETTHGKTPAEESIGRDTIPIDTISGPRGVSHACRSGPAMRSFPAPSGRPLSPAAAPVGFHSSSRPRRAGSPGRNTAAQPASSSSLTKADVSCRASGGALLARTRLSYDDSCHSRYRTPPGNVTRRQPRALA